MRKLHRPPNTIVGVEYASFNERDRDCYHRTLGDITFAGIRFHSDRPRGGEVDAEPSKRCLPSPANLRSNIASLPDKADSCRGPSAGLGPRSVDSVSGRRRVRNHGARPLFTGSSALKLEALIDDPKKPSTPLQFTLASGPAKRVKLPATLPRSSRVTRHDRRGCGAASRSRRQR